MDGTDPGEDPGQLRRLLRLVADTGQVDGAIVDTDLQYTSVYSGASGRQGEDVDTDLLPGETTEPARLLERAAVEGESRVEETFSFAGPDGQSQYRAAAEPLYDGDEVEGAVFAAVDISDRYRLLDRATEAVYTVDPDWEITFWNRQMAARTGWTADEAVGETLWEVFGDALPPEFERRYRSVMETGEPAEFEQYLPEPFECWVGVRVFADRDGLSVFSRDITDRKRREQELQRSREFLAQTQEVAEVGGWVVEFATATLEWTDEVYRIYGVPTDEEVSIEKAVGFYHPEDRERVAEAFNSLQVDGEPYDLDFRIVTREGQVRWVRTRAEPLYEDDELVGARGTVQEITERKQREQQLVRQRDNIELLDQIVRHDIRNNLQLISGHATALAEHVEGDEHEHVESIQTNAQAAVELTKSARELAEVLLQDDDSREPFALRPVVRSQVEKTRAAHDSASVTVSGTIPESRVPANGMLSSVFRNLLKNAVQHNDRAVPEVVVSAAVDDGTVTVRVADNGPGVPDEMKDRIFEQGGQRLESAGTGVGLYLVQTLVESYDGSVRVEDNDPRGAVFVVELPTVA